MPITATNPFKGREFPGEVILLCVRCRRGRRLRSCLIPVVEADIQSDVTMRQLTFGLFVLLLGVPPHRQAESRLGIIKGLQPPALFEQNEGQADARFQRCLPTGGRRDSSMRQGHAVNAIQTEI